MKKVFALLGVALIGVLAWVAAGPDPVAVDARRVTGRSGQGAVGRGQTPAPRVPRAVGRGQTPAPRAPRPAPSIRTDAPPETPLPEPAVPPEIIAPIATETAPPPVVANEPPSMRDADAPRAMIIPVAGVGRGAIRDMFDEVRGNGRHEAIDILAPRGTPVIATDDGIVKKLFTSKPGGLTVYQFDPDQRFCYYYAHLDGYAPGLHEGQLLRRGEVLGYVGTTGNSRKDTPHLHFALIRLDRDKRWWKGTYVNPYPFLAPR